MAARENQGYLIAVIILVLFVLVFGLLAFLGISKANEYSEQSANLKNELSVSEKVSKANQIQAEILRAYIGDLDVTLAEVPTQFASLEQLSRSDNSLSETQRSAIKAVEEQTNEVRDAYNRDMRQFVARTSDDQSEEQTWTAVFRNLVQVTAAGHNALNVEKNQNIEDMKRLETEKQSLQERLTQNEMALKKKEEELASVKKLSSDNIAELMSQFKQAQSDIEANNRKTSEDLAKLQLKYNNLRSANEKLDLDYGKLKAENIALKAENFDLHDGTIVRVARGSNMVFLDIGSADGLRSNQTFAVYDRHVNNFEKDSEKAKIEVIRVTGPHTADARITEENPVDPITRFDYVVTPTWDPGYRVPIALAGIFDLDNDGNSDQAQFIRMIENNGGRVVAFHDSEGNVNGTIDASTRYLVLGESPQPGPEGVTQGNIYSAMRNLEKLAGDKSVPVIDTRKMMNWMGRHNRASIERGNPKIQKFRPRSIDGSDSSNGSGSSAKGSDTTNGSDTNGSGTNGSGSSTR